MNIIKKNNFYVFLYNEGSQIIFKFSSNISIKVYSNSSFVYLNLLFNYPFFSIMFNFNI